MNPKKIIDVINAVASGAGETLPPELREHLALTEVSDVTALIVAGFGTTAESVTDEDVTTVVAELIASGLVHWRRSGRARWATARLTTGGAVDGYEVKPSEIQGLTEGGRKHLRDAIRAFNAASPYKRAPVPKGSPRNREELLIQARERATQIKHTATESIYRGTWSDGTMFEVMDRNSPEIQVCRAEAAVAAMSTIVERATKELADADLAVVASAWRAYQPIDGRGPVDAWWHGPVADAWGSPACDLNNAEWTLTNRRRRLRSVGDDLVSAQEDLARLRAAVPRPVVTVSAEIADAFGMRGLPNTVVLEPVKPLPDSDSTAKVPSHADHRTTTTGNDELGLAGDAVPASAGDCRQGAGESGVRQEGSVHVPSRRGVRRDRREAARAEEAGPQAGKPAVAWRRVLVSLCHLTVADAASVASAVTPEAGATHEKHTKSMRSLLRYLAVKKHFVAPVTHRRGFWTPTPEGRAACAA